MKDTEEKELLQSSDNEFQPIEDQLEEEDSLEEEYVEYDEQYEKERKERREQLVQSWISKVKQNKMLLMKIAFGVIIAVALIIVFAVVIPTKRYNSAVSNYDNGNYLKVIQICKNQHEQKYEKLYYKACYRYAIELIEKEEFDEAFQYLDIVPQEYRKLSNELDETIYAKVNELCGKDQLDDAYRVLQIINNPKTDREEYKNCYYLLAQRAYRNQQYKEAVDYYLNVLGYKDTDEKIPEAKYSYITSHKDQSDLVTYEYLKDLKQWGYLDTETIFADLYKWTVSIVVNDSANDRTKELESFDLSKQSVYIHAIVGGGEPGATTTIYYEITHGGSDDKDIAKNGYASSGDQMISGFAFDQKIYTSDLEYDQTGSYHGDWVKVVFYDNNKRIIGAAKVSDNYFKYVVVSSGEDVHEPEMDFYTDRGYSMVSSYSKFIPSLFDNFQNSTTIGSYTISGKDLYNILTNGYIIRENGIVEDVQFYGCYIIKTDIDQAYGYLLGHGEDGQLDCWYFEITIDSNGKVREVDIKDIKAFPIVFIDGKEYYTSGFEAGSTFGIGSYVLTEKHWLYGNKVSELFVKGIGSGTPRY